MDGRDARAGSRLDIDEILNDLYASEINASISWIWDGGFYVTLGNPKQAEGLGLPEHRRGCRMAERPSHRALPG
jgi:hypothetical protein